MNPFVREHLEDYLSGTLTGQQRAEFEMFLKGNPSDAEELALHVEAAELLRDLRAPEDELLDADPGFYARVMERIDSQRQTPFWMVFLEPLFIRRLAFASLMWLALLGGYVATNDGPAADKSKHVAEQLLTEPPDYGVVMGSDLDRNRNAMLTTLASRR